MYFYSMVQVIFVNLLLAIIIAIQEKSLTSFQITSSKAIELKNKIIKLQSDNTIITKLY